MKEALGVGETLPLGATSRDVEVGQAKLRDTFNPPGKIKFSSAAPVGHNDVLGGPRNGRLFENHLSDVSNNDCIVVPFSDRSSSDRLSAAACRNAARRLVLSKVTILLLALLPHAYLCKLRLKHIRSRHTPDTHMPAS